MGLFELTVEAFAQDISLRNLTKYWIVQNDLNFPAFAACLPPGLLRMLTTYHAEVVDMLHLDGEKSLRDVERTESPSFPSTPTNNPFLAGFDTMMEEGLPWDEDSLTFTDYESDFHEDELMPSHEDGLIPAAAPQGPAPGGEVAVVSSASVSFPSHGFDTGDTLEHYDSFCYTDEEQGTELEEETYDEEQSSDEDGADSCGTAEQALCGGIPTRGGVLTPPLHSAAPDTHPHEGSDPTVVLEWLPSAATHLKVSSSDFPLGGSASTCGPAHRLASDNHPTLCDLSSKSVCTCDRRPFPLMQGATSASAPSSASVLSQPPGALAEYRSVRNPSL
jgi:hypothetical protein